MNKVKLIKLYEEQKSILQEMIDALKQKQKAIIKNDSMLVEEANHIEEIALNKLERKEVERFNLIRSISAELGMNITEITPMAIKGFYNLLKNNLNKENNDLLVSLRNENKKLVMEANLLNKQNKLLVEQANNFIKQVISVLFKSQNKPLLDRKV